MPLTAADSSRRPLRKEPPLLSGLREKEACLEAGKEWASLPSESIRPKESGCPERMDGYIFRGLLRTPGKLAQWEAAVALTADACFCNYMIHARR